MGSERQLDIADIHDVLRNDRRREVLSSLHSNSGQASIRDLSEHIAAVESDEDPPPRNVRQSVYVSLHQTHLPKLDELGIIDYDTDAKSVELRPEAEEIWGHMQAHNSEPGMLAGIALLGAILGVAVTGLAAFGSGLMPIDPVLASFIIFVAISFVSAAAAISSHTGGLLH